MATERKFDRICMVGLGYIGLPTAAVIASRGVDVIGIDVDQAAIDTINEGKVHIVEPDLDIVVRSVVTTGNLRATRVAEPADAFLIAVPTPFTRERKPDVSFIRSAAETIAPALESGNLVVLESTSPVGTTESLSEWLAEYRPDLSFPHQAGGASDIRVAYCPERVLPGHVLQELVNNDRIVGGMSAQCAEHAADLYRLFVRGDCLLTTVRTAELCKLTENAFRDVNIAFANEMSMVCDHLSVNVWELIELSNRHPRVNILQPGPGVGGHCIAVDPWFLVDSAPEAANLIRMARQVNDAKPQHVLERVLARADKFKAPQIACFGLAFKADIDDLRQSPALDIVRQLAGRVSGDVMVVEPNIRQLPASLATIDNLLLMDIDTAFERADIIVGLVDHKEFKLIAADRLKEKVIIDTRGMWR